MIPWLAVLIWAYVATRLVQVPIEYEGQSDKARGILAILSIAGAVVATMALSAIWDTATRTPPTP